MSPAATAAYLTNWAGGILRIRPYGKGKLGCWIQYVPMDESELGDLPTAEILLDSDESPESQLLKILQVESTRIHLTLTHLRRHVAEVERDRTKPF